MLLIPESIYTTTYQSINQIYVCVGVYVCGFYLLNSISISLGLVNAKICSSLNTSLKELSATVSVMQGSSKELSSLVAGRV